jgi:hypothetical protein
MRRLQRQGRGKQWCSSTASSLGPRWSSRRAKRRSVAPRVSSGTQRLTVLPCLLVSAASFDARFPNQVSKAAIRSVASGPPHLTIRLLHPFSHISEPNKALLAKVSPLLRPMLYLRSSYAHSP